MKTIPLTQGKVAQVDDIAFDFLSQWKWHAVRNNSGIFYAVRAQGVAHGKQQRVYMHQIVCGVRNADHKDGNGLNNQGSNLRPCAISLNHANASLGRRNTTGFKGVYADAHNKTVKWIAAVYFENRRHYLGRFPTARDAALVYDAKAREVFGPFARTNADLGLL